MTTFHYVIGGSILLGIVLAGIAYLRGRKAQLVAHEKLTVIDNEDFDGEVGEEFPHPDLPRAELSNLTMDNFDAFKAGAKRPVVVEFYADWCSGCRNQMPLMEQAAHELNARADFYKVDHDEFNGLLQYAGVRKIPTSFFVDPRTRKQIVHVGVLSVEEIATKLDELAALSLTDETSPSTDRHPYLLDHSEEL